jgi:tight adherence protein B
MYPKGAMIINEFAYITKQIQMNIPVEKALRDFASRSGIEDIISFSEVFSTAKRTGGDLTKIIKTTTDIISNKIEVKREIVTLIAAKKFEANIMKIVPAGILCYLSLSSPEMLKPLYHNLFGILIMTFILGVYLCSYKLIDKIVDIEV